MKKILGLLFTFLVLFTGCSNLKQKPISLTGKEYILTQSKKNPNILIGFDEFNFYGFSGVNNYFGRYTLKKNSLKLEVLGTTLMAGPSENLQLEKTYLNKLDNVKKFKLINDDLILILKDGSELKYTPFKSTPKKK